MTGQWKQISGLYDAALRLPEDERADYLKKHAPNENVRLEVESLLAHEHSGEQLLKSPAMEVAAEIMAEQTPILNIGQTLGHYKISTLLGKGGMGEVYQAKDTKLGRHVAIKVLPFEFTLDAGRVERFQREARLLASLNHPNIASIYGLEESGGSNYLVMELVEGNTLADLIKAGPVPVEEALKLAMQIAEGLEAAHEKGVIHRDLKPANIKVTPEGKVKILDFGLAKAFAPEQGEVKPEDSPTISAAATRHGVILGTAAYMSPEQAKGKIVDKRSDIWAFGCVMFEMLTGHPAFSGNDVTDLIAAIIRSEPEWGSLPLNLHWRSREVLEHCLKKDVKERYRDIADVKSDIRKVLDDPSGVSIQPVTAAGHRMSLRNMLSWIAAIVLMAVIAGVAVWELKPPEPKHIIRFAFELPEGLQLNQYSDLGFLDLAVSPDGTQVVYATTEGLYLRSLDSMETRPIKGTDKGSLEPFFSPDGKWIGYWSSSEGKLKKIAISGGVPEVLCDTHVVIGGSWCSDDTIVYSDSRTGIMRIPAKGGTPESLAKGSYMKLNEGLPILPQKLPDGKTLLFTNTTDLDNKANWKIIAQSLDTGEQKVVLKSGFGAGYLPTKHLVYALETNGTISLYSVAFDIEKLEITGIPVQIIDNIQACAVSASGTLAYISGIAAIQPPGGTLVWVDRNGKEEPLGTPPDIYSYPKISPDGKQVAVSVGQLYNEDIAIWDVNRKTMTPLTFDKTREALPVWTPDGRRIIYYSNHENSDGGVYRKAADGSGDVEKLASVPGRVLYPFSCTRDGRTLLMQELNSSSYKWDISMLEIEGDRTRKLLLQTEYDEHNPQVSPNGHWMAYIYGGLNEGIYVSPFPEADKGKWKVSTGYAYSPLWSPDGRELFYFSSDGFVMAAPVETGPTPRFLTPKRLFKYIYTGLSPFPGNPWDINPKDGRFLMIKPQETTPEAAHVKGTEAFDPRKINIVLNWLEELKQKAPIQ